MRAMGAVLTYGMRPGGPARAFPGMALGCAGESCGPGCKGGMGCPGPLGGLFDSATGVASGSVKLLQLEVNRFASAPGSLRTSPVPVSGSLDFATATAATTILLRRAQAAAAGEQAIDPATARIYAQALAAVTNPIPFVAANLGRVTEMVTMFADLNGLPEAAFVRAPKHIPPVVVIAAAAGGAALLWKLFKKGRR